MENQLIAVLAISTKKEQGWIKVANALTDSWSDLGAHFDKAKFGAIFTAPGLYEVSFMNTAGFGANPAFSVTQAKSVGSFAELAQKAK